MASGQAVRRLTLDQEIVGSNPTSPAIEKRETACLSLFYYLECRMRTVFCVSKSRFGVVKLRAEVNFEHS